MGEYLSKLKDLSESNVSKPGLVRVVELLKRLGNPQNGLKSVHVAGTNGKGSTCTYIESILRHAGYKTGLFSSPHIYDIREYIKTGNEMIPEDKLEEYAKSAFEICEQMVSDGFNHPTFFEIMTGIALDYFSDIGIDIAVIEAGMGGKGDATNVIYPMLSVITRISYDHTAFLGNTIAKIASEKAGIIKNGIPTVLAPNQLPAARKAIKKKCKKAGSELIDAGQYDIHIYDMSLDCTCFFAKRDNEILRFKMKNIGAHQAENVVTALSAAEEIAKEGFDIDYTAIKKGINSTLMDSRIQVFKDKKIVIDASHNPDSVYELKAALQAIIPEEKKILLCSVLNSKDLDAMAREYKGFISYAVLTESPHPLAEKVQNLHAAFEKHSIECTALEKLDEAVGSAEEKCAEEDAYLIVSGSFYMIADVKKTLKLI
jgi:dihydrofolate synthase/folylpolyglutamate synthase